LRSGDLRDLVEGLGFGEVRDLIFSNGLIEVPVERKPMKIKRS
jgi:hypothetical protein